MTISRPPAATQLMVNISLQPKNQAKNDKKE